MVLYTKDPCLFVVFFFQYYIENSTKYTKFLHQWDVWHGAKNLGKKLIAVSFLFFINILNICCDLSKVKFL